MGGSGLADRSADAPFRQLVIDLRRDEIPGAIGIVALHEQVVIVGQDMAGISDHRQPGRVPRRGGPQAGAVHGMIDDRAEFVLRQPRRQMPESGLDVSAPAQFAASPIGAIQLRDLAAQASISTSSSGIARPETISSVEAGRISSPITAERAAL